MEKHVQMMPKSGDNADTITSGTRPGSVGLSTETSCSPHTEDSAPHTERTDPPVPSTESFDVELQTESSHEFASRVAETKASLQADAHSNGPDDSKKEDSRFSTVTGGVEPSRVTGHGSATEESDSGNATLQSMRRPELIPGGIPHSRRFLSIERELEQCSATIKLLEKGQRRVKKEARIAWIIATVAVGLAIAAVAT